MTRRNGIVVLLSLAMALGLIDRINFSVALAAKDFQAWFGLTDGARGMLSSAFFWTYAPLQIAAGWVVDRYGVRWPFAIGFLLWSAATVATAAAGSVAMLLAVRLLLGVGESLLSPGALRWIRMHFAESRRGFVVGVVMAGSKFGPAIGAPVAAWLTVAHGWRTMFVLMGAVPLIWLWPWVALAREEPRWGSPPACRDRPGGLSYRPLRSRAVAGILISSFCYQYFVYFCLTWMPAYFVERRHLDLGAMGWYAMFSFAGTAIIAAAAGWAADRLIGRGRNPVNVRRAFAIAGLVFGATELAGALAHSSGVALFFAVFSLSGVGLTTANHWALAQSLVPAGMAGQMAGLQACAASLPGIVAPLVTGWLKQSTGGYDAPMQAVGLFLALGILSYAVLVRESGAPAAAARSLS